MDCTDVGYLCCYHETYDTNNWELHKKPSPGSSFTTDTPSILGTRRDRDHATGIFHRLLQYRLNVAQLVVPSNKTTNANE